MKTRKIILLVALLVVLMGAVSATGVSDETLGDDTLDSSDRVAQYTTPATVEESVTSQPKESKKIVKEEKNSKTAGKTYDVNDYDTLHSVLTSDVYDRLTLNIKSNVKLKGNTELNEAIKTVTINGGGKTIDGSNYYQFLRIESANVTINNVKIINCYSTDNGGAIYNSNGKLIINNTVLSNNIAYDDINRKDNYGGAIYNDKGILNISNSTLNNNQVRTDGWAGDASGGAIYNNNGKLTISACKLNNNSVLGYNGNGGAVYTGGKATITNTTLNNNRANSNAGSSYDGYAYGGAIYNVMDLTMENMTVNNNTAVKESRMSTYNNGAIYNSKGNLIINNATLKNNIIAICSNGTLTMTDSRINNDTIDNDHGKMTINNSTLNNNSSISNYYGNIILNNCTLKNSKYVYNGTMWSGFDVTGGAIHNMYSTMTINNSILKNYELYSVNDDAAGGAIYNYEGKMTINNSLLDNNTVKGEYEDNTLGGAIYNEGDLIINNTTFTNNTAPSGGAIYNEGNLSITNSILANNKATYGGAIFHNGSNFNMTKSIFTNNTAINGAAIYNHGKASIEENTFQTNKAQVDGKAIIKAVYATTSNNTNAETSKYSGTIYTRTYADVTIINNIFDDGIKYTKTTVQTNNGIIGEKLTLKATVTDTNNQKVNEGNLIFKLNGVTIKDNGKLTGSNNPLKVKVANGTATATIKPDLDMRNADKLTAHYIGTDLYNASASSTAKIQIIQRNASIVVSTNVKTIKQGQVLTLIAKVYDTTNGKKSTNLTAFNDQFVYFKVNGITLKDTKGAMLKVKIVNGTATTQYTIPLGLSGVTDGKTMTPKNHTILAGFYNKNYQEDIRNTTYFQVERSNITITITNATVNAKTHKLSLTATIRDYLGNIVKGPNKCVIKINGISLKNGTQARYYYSTDGILNIQNIDIPSYTNYKTIEIVTQDRLAYKSQRNTTTTIKVTK
ncbi:Ig-like domain-containing protein [Methanosphaera sp. BMS]|uniref:Ig-like domain-containing protein n=1 Tax=Methanosphaera sp. BMS TaxID=1789762 RepID=UPI000DC1D0DD|nr:Ig-like domain-containing protein [Methanosphaera sp. BMS]AWX31828.1 hypothetical protein AW729_01420 [Methanosphaera sp. BMS]